MKKNVSGQKIGAQMITAADGTAFTGSVTVSVTGDAGTQATGSVGSGACTHEGSGYHTYAPAQAETNYDLIAFTFTGTGAIPVTVQVFTSFPQTGDSYSRIGTAGLGLTDLPWNAAWDAEVQSECADALNAYDPPTNAEMEARTIVSASYATATDLATVDTVVDGIKAKTDNLPSDPADASDVASAFGTVNSTLATIAGYIDTEIAGLVTAVGSLGTTVATVAGNVTSIKAKTDNLPASPAGTGDIPTANANADALLDRADAIETGITPRKFMRAAGAVLTGELTGAGTDTEEFAGIGSLTTRVTVEADSSGNRTDVTLNL